MLQGVNGSKFYIGTRVALPTDLEVELSDFTGQETHWLEVKGWTQSGALGNTRAEITQPFIGSGRDHTIKGSANSAAMENTFAPLANDPGQIRMAQAAEDCANYAFKVEWGANCAAEGPVTISVADPGVVTWAGGHGLEVGSPIIFDATGGNMPTGLTEGTVYYVKTVLSPTTFTVAATPDGEAIETTLAATATSITATAQPAGMTDLFFGLAMPGAKSGGAANTPLLRTWSVKPNTNIVEV
jgi:hypothetical protein